MGYQGYTSFSEFVNYNATRISEMGFISFISDHTLAVGIGIVILFLLYKFFVEPIVKEQNRIGGEENE